MKDLAPEDIMLETNNKGVSESVPNTKKIMFHVSPDNSMQKDDRSNKPRYDRDFFNKHIVNVLKKILRKISFHIRELESLLLRQRKEKQQESLIFLTILMPMYQIEQNL